MKQSLTPTGHKVGVKKIFCSLRLQNLSPHFQNRGAAPGSESY